MAKIEIGSKFGRLVVASKGRLVGRNRYWLCKCQCGRSKEISYASLSRGITKSCGCLNSELASQRRLKHGKSNTREYDIWVNMRQRCEDKKCGAYQNYGGRGIFVCDRWQMFDNFFADMGDSKGKTIERIDNEKGYEPNNCIWASAKEQANNKRSNIRVQYEGRTQTIQQWAEEIKMSYWTLRSRIVVLGWDAHAAFTKPIRRKI